jgi:hypothetical protein
MCHSRGGGNLVSVAWIPACAGMTNGGLSPRSDPGADGLEQRRRSMTSLLFQLEQEIGFGVVDVDIERRCGRLQVLVGN